MNYKHLETLFILHGVLNWGLSGKEVSSRSEMAIWCRNMGTRHKLWLWPQIEVLGWNLRWISFNIPHNPPSKLACVIRSLLVADIRTEFSLFLLPWCKNEVWFPIFLAWSSCSWVMELIASLVYGFWVLRSQGWNCRSKKLTWKLEGHVCNLKIE